MKIKNIAKKYKIKQFSYCGENIMKVENVLGKKNGKLVLVSAMTSNATGIGKTTISIGLADAMNLLRKKTMLALREPSMGPVFGIKGGATGGGLATIVPSEEINLHFTGDFHAVAQANNLLASIIDNHIYFGNQLEIDTNNICFKRCLDLNDRSLREISYEIADKKINTGFNITAASEIMAIMSLSRDLNELKENLSNIVVATNVRGEHVHAKDLSAQDSMLALLVKAFKPNLVQTLGGTGALVHMGPFANIAHGCNSVVATKYALTHANYCVTEAGFGSDLGAEKFLDIKTRILNKIPDAVVLVVVAKVVKEHGEGNLDAGLKNVARHIHNLKDVFKLNVVVAVNVHSDDSENELNQILTFCKKQGVEAELCYAFTQGGRGCINLAKAVTRLCEKENHFEYCYNMQDDIKTKIEKIATKIYGAKRVIYDKVAEEKLKSAPNDFFVNIAKTQFSFTDDKTKLGAPNDFDFHINDIEIRSGAKMVVAIAGKMLLMPALAKKSNYLNVKVGENAEILGVD